MITQTAGGTVGTMDRESRAGISTDDNALLRLVDGSGSPLSNSEGTSVGTKFAVDITNQSAVTINGGETPSDSDLYVKVEVTNTSSGGELNVNAKDFDPSKETLSVAGQSRTFVYDNGNSLTTTDATTVDFSVTGGGTVTVDLTFVAELGDSSLEVPREGIQIG